MPIAQEMKNLAEDIEASYGERLTTLQHLIAETRQMQRRFRDEHKEMAQALGSFLDNSESTRITEFKEMLRSIQSRQGAREEEVAEMIKKFEDELAQMASQLKEFLSDSEATRLEDFKSTLATIRSRQREREEETVELLGSYQRDLAEARGYWQNLAKIMASKRTGRKVPITEVPKEAEVSPRVEEEAEKAFTQGELKARALDIITESPEGISLRQLGEKLRVPYVRLARPVSDLANEGKVAKRDSLYYPMRAESEV